MSTKPQIQPDGRTLNHNQTVVRSKDEDWDSPQHNQTLVPVGGQNLNHNQTLRHVSR
jgi:hypothetical protein